MRFKFRKSNGFSMMTGLLLLMVSAPHGVRAVETVPEGAEPAASAGFSALLEASREPLPEESLEALVAEVLEKNPEIRAARAAWEASRKRIWQASALPDPEAGIDIMGAHTETRTGPQEQRFMIMQKIPFPWKLWERHQAARAESEAMKLKSIAIEREILNRLRRAYYELYRTDASIGVIREIHGILAGFEQVAGARYASLSGGQRDAAKAQAEVSMTLRSLLELKQQRESVSAYLVMLLNRDPLSTMGRAMRPDLPEFSRTLPEVITLASRNREKIEMMEKELERARHEQHLSRLEYFPDVEVGFVYTVVGGGTSMHPDDGRDSWMIPLRFNLPVWQNRLIPAIQEAGKKVEEAEARLQGSRNETFYEVRDAYFRFQSSRETAGLYEQAVIPQARLALTSDQAGYQAGSTEFLNFLDSERVYLNARLGFIQAYTEALKSYADLERAAGLDLNNQGENHESN